MDQLTVFGLAAVSSTLATYALEDRSPWFILAFAFACLGRVSLGLFLQGTWPFGLLEAILGGRCGVPLAPAHGALGRIAAIRFPVS